MQNALVGTLERWKTACVRYLCTSVHVQGFWLAARSSWPQAALPKDLLPKGESRRKRNLGKQQTSAGTPWARKHRNIVGNNGAPIAQWLIAPFASLLRRLGMGLLLLPSQCFLLPPHTKSSPRKARCLLRTLSHRNPGSHHLQPAFQCA